MQALKLEVPSQLLSPAAHESFEGSYDPVVITSGPDVYSVPRPVSWTVDLTNTGDAILVTGSVEGTVTTSCARCLGDVEVPIIGEIEGYFIIGSDAEAPDGMDDDEFDLLPDDGAIDLASLIVAAIVLELPLVPLCDEDCKGLCPTCGANLNEGPCDCPPVEGGELGRKNPFSVLKGYSFE